MATLADIAANLRGPGGPSAEVTYREYVLNCSERGVTPLSVEAWKAAGKPSGL